MKKVEKKIRSEKQFIETVFHSLFSHPNFNQSNFDEVTRKYNVTGMDLNFDGKVVLKHFDGKGIIDLFVVYIELTECEISWLNSLFFKSWYIVL